MDGPSEDQVEGKACVCIQLAAISCMSYTLEQWISISVSPLTKYDLKNAVSCA